MLLIGSHALIHNIGDIGRTPLDYDIIATFSELAEITTALRKQTRLDSIPLSKNKTVLKCADGRIVEVEIAWSDGTGVELEKMLYDGRAARHLGKVDYYPFAGFAMPVATLDQLYMLKMSHRYLKNSPHFRKTRNDIIKMRAHGAKIIDTDWLKRREDETYWYKHPKLNVKKGDFFKGDGVQYVYDHDDIHKAVAHYREYDWNPNEELDKWEPLPAYRMYMKDGAEVDCDKEKFFAAHESVRLLGVLEEAQVLALERSQIPFRGKVDPRRSFDIALQKVCTSITSGWFREFAWENFDKVEALYEPDYVDRFWKAVDAGRVKPFSGDVYLRDRSSDS